MYLPYCLFVNIFSCNEVPGSADVKDAAVRQKIPGVPFYNHFMVMERYSFLLCCFCIKMSGTGNI